MNAAKGTGGPPRVLLVGSAQGGNLEASYVAAFRQLGCPVETFHLAAAVAGHVRLGRLGRTLHRFLPVEPWVRKANRELILAAVRFRPTVVVVVGSQEVQAGALTQVKVVTGAALVLVWPDSLYSLSAGLTACLPVFDLVGLFGRRMVELAPQLGVRRAIWLPLAADPSLHAPVVVTEEERRRYGAVVSFIGGWRPEREQRLRELVDAGLKIWGPNWDRECADRELVRRCWQGRDLRGQEFAKAVAATQVNLNIVEATNPASPNMRFFELPMCGGFQWATPCPEMANEYRPGEHLWCLEEGTDLRTVLQTLLKDPARLARLAAAGHQLTVQRHTYLHRAEQLLAELTVAKAGG